MPSIAIPVSLRGQLLNSTSSSAPPPAFSPSTLFALNEPGIWLDPSDVANLAWRRNLLTFTEQFDNAVWSKSNATVVANTAVAPDGTATADRLVEAATTSFHGINPPLTTKTTQTWSIYAKEAERRYVIVTLGEANTATFGGGIFVDLRDGTVLSATGAKLVNHAVTPAGGGWYRCSVTVNSTGAATDPFPFVFMSDNSTHTIGANYGSKSYVGNTTNGILIWGAQLEVGSVATDYQRITDVNTEVIERFPSATLYQDPAGTIPVTTPGQTVALALDKSKGLVLGSELVTNGDFASGTTGWTFDAGWSVTSGEAAASTSANQFSNIRQTIAAIATAGVGKTFRVSFSVPSYTSGPAAIKNGNNTILLTVTAAGSYSFLYTVPSGITNGSFIVEARGATGTNTFTIDNISVKELPGFHATQATLASRPTYGVVPLGGRRNLLTRTEEFDNAAWTKTRSSITANAGVAPDGTTTADKLVEDSTPTNTHVTLQAPSGIVAGAYTATVYAKSAERSRVVISNEETSGSNGVFAVFNLGTGAIDVAATAFGTGFSGAAATITSVGSGWYRCSVSGTTSATTRRISINLDNATSGAISQTYTGNGTSGILIWGAQLELGSSATAYQRVGSAFDVTEAGVASLSYLSFDGVDDFLITPTITPGVDKAQVFAGVRKLSDAAVGVIAEFSADYGTNAGAFVTYNQSGSGLQGWGHNSKGTIAANNAVTTGYAAPITNVLTGLGDIAGDRATLRVNGTQVAQVTTDQGTGNYLAYPLYIGRRAGTSLPFNGQLYSLLVRFGTNLDAGTITSTETWVNSKTGAYT